MEKVLEKMDSPEDLRRLPRELLPQLAQEVREEIIRVVSERGGHLAPSLGAVELTIALHYCFDTPRDKILWDVGHQAYAHKILTGRRDRFRTLRQRGGISGFPRRAESPYDVYDSGHSGGALPVALGMAEAKALRGEDFRVVAVIGDGTLTTGVAFEAMNCAGAWKSDLIVVLNDNEMSISKSVGALSAYLNRIMTGQWVTRFREDLKRLLHEVPGGRRLFRLMKYAEEALKGVFTPGLLFEELGFKYVGPLDGHNLYHLIETLENVKRLKGPVLLHVITKKGKGYPPAEEDPTLFHGVGKFDRSSGTFPGSGGPPTYTEVFGRTLLELASKDERIVAITAAMPLGTGLAEFAKRFPDRFFDVGIAEQAAVSLAAGLALEGLRPVVAIYSTFLQRAYDQIVQEVALQRLPVLFAVDRGGIVGEDGPTHHGLFDLSYLRSVPGMTVMAPKDEGELRQMLWTALGREDGPVALRYPRSRGVGVPLEGEPQPLEWGKGEVLREGSRLLILAIGSMVYPALEAAELLASQGLSPTVVNARFVKPLDEALVLRLARGHEALLTVEENVLEGGFGSAVLQLLEREGVLKRVKCMGAPSEFLEHGTRGELLEAYGLGPESICREALRLVG
ncbi:MAG: 1-deoxy-D-xylulose-5-phosphate synthase [Deltaproteobacteria bacterium]|nr:MAG: 1-deoxy-D-xylulose-5-phosphate synthase [Deltaproteobacteria bacterium]